MPAEQRAKSADVKLTSGETVQLHPLGYYVLIEPLTKERSDGGIILPNADKTKDLRWGRVVAVGDGEWQGGQHVTIPLEPRDIVAYQWSRGVAFNVKQHALHAINYREVLFAMRNAVGLPLGELP